MSRTIKIAVALLAAGASSVLAQRTPYSLYPGSVLRITVSPGNRVSGSLFRSDAEGIVVRHEGDTTRVAWCDVQRLEIARATRSANPVKTGATVGGVVGLFAGLGVTAFCSSFHIIGDPDPCPEWIPIGVLAGAAVGATVGSLIWSASYEGRWKDIPLDRVRVGLVPAPNGIGVAGRVTF